MKVRNIVFIVEVHHRTLIFLFVPSHYLHKEARAERLSDVDIVVLGGKICGGSLQVEPVHNPAKLLTHVVRGLEGAVVHEVVVAPLGIFHVLNLNKLRNLFPFHDKIRLLH